MDRSFDTFPWPQTPTRGQIVEVAAAAVTLRGLRREMHALLDKADPLAALLALNLACAAKEKAGAPITPPGLPVAHPAEFTSGDCIRPFP